MKKNKKYFFTLRPISLIGCFWMLIWSIILPLVGGYFLYNIFLLRIVRLITIKDGMIIVHEDPVIFNAYQYGVKVNIKDINSLTFEFTYGNSKEEQMTHPVTSPCLALFLKNGDIVRIMMFGYTKKQYKLIEKEILKNNDEITTINDAQTFITRNGFHH